MRLEVDLLQLAQRQHGAVSTRQARELGLDRWQVRRIVDSGRWSRATDRVLVAGRPEGRGLALSVATLHDGGDASISHRAGAGWWRVPGFSLRPIHTVTTAHHSEQAEGRVRHLVRSLPARWTTVLDGVPVVRPELLMMQLCATVHPERAERALDNAWKLRLLTARTLIAFLEDHAARGRNGIALLRELVEVRGVDYRPPDSGLEGRVTKILGDAGLRFRRQVDLGDEDDWLGRTDFVATDLPLILEVQSELHHSALLDVEADAARRGRLEDAGFSFVEVTDTEVWTSPSTVVRRVGAAVRSVRSVSSRQA